MIRSCTLICLGISTGLALGQTNVTSIAQVQMLQAKARAALISSAQPASLVLDGTFTSTEGSLTQSGNAHLTVGSDGSFLVNLSRSVGQISESRTVSQGIPACTWTDQDNVIHSSSSLNCLPPAWFFPGFTLLPLSNDPSLPAWTPTTYSTDSLGGHLRFQFVLPDLNGMQPDPQLSSSFDLVLAPNSLLPQFAIFTVHPENPGINADIPVKIAYSNYKNVSGVMVPFQIQRFVNDSLVLDLEITAASVQ